jgi:signal transduction histidine kinase
MITLGGFIEGSVVIIWSILAPMGALLSGQLRQAIYWFFAFIFLVVISGFIQPLVVSDNNLPSQLVIFFFILNISTVSFITYLILNYFVKQKNKVVKLVHKNRELEVNQLQQEVRLRQSEKLATLGKLSAGIAHELNNPATAGLRGSKKLSEIIPDLEKSLIRLGQSNLSEGQYEIFNNFKDQILERTKDPKRLDPIERSDREQEIGLWLESKRIPDHGELSALLAPLDFKPNDLSKFADKFSSAQFPDVLLSLCHIFLSQNLLAEIGQGTGRITEIVKSLKSYSYQGTASIQSINVHEGLNDTLVMLRSQIKSGITVERQYDEDLPHIEARGNELNQVWTNIIDNAITAMNGKGTLKIKTFRQDNWIIVQISDTGHGIPEDVKNKIFDPFFTTKSPGEGTGLGLNISYNIVVEEHQGEFKVVSKPGETCFEVKLPIKDDVVEIQQ